MARPQGRAWLSLVEEGDLDTRDHVCSVTQGTEHGCCVVTQT